MQDNLPVLITFAWSLLLCDIASQRVPEIKTWVLQVHYSAYYTRTALSGARGYVVAGIDSFISA